MQHLISFFLAGLLAVAGRAPTALANLYFAPVVPASSSATTIPFEEHEERHTKGHQSSSEHRSSRDRTPTYSPDHDLCPLLTRAPVARVSSAFPHPVHTRQSAILNALGGHLRC